MGRIVLREGDITAEPVDAIVNAANSALRLGSGVAGAIREKGGPTIQQECDAHGPVEVGGAAITGAGTLPAKYVVHAAGMAPGGRASEESVRASFAKSLALADEAGCASVAVPAIGAGVGGLSPQRCAEVLLEVAREHLAGGTGIEEIRFVLFGEPMYRLFESAHDAAKVAEQMARLRSRPGRNEG
ncbi:MAG: macro domain-containing protein [Myxococcota bacterium]